MTEKLIGHEIEGFCRKCKVDTLHVITALKGDKIDKTMCKVCMSYHKFHKPMAGVAEPTIKKSKQKPAKILKSDPDQKIKRRPRRDKWTRLLEDIDANLAIEYQMDKVYEMSNTIHHKTFGLGVVKNIIDNQKIEVLFHDGQKLLVQNLHR